MYSQDEVKEALRFYKECGSVTLVTRKLGYPSAATLHMWLSELKKSGRENLVRGSRQYTRAMREQAVDHYLRNGRNVSRTLRELGYPTREILLTWLSASCPEQIRRHRPPQPPEKICAGEAQAFGVSDAKQYGWMDSLCLENSKVKPKQLPKKDAGFRPDHPPENMEAAGRQLDEAIRTIENLSKKIEGLAHEHHQLMSQIQRLQMENDVLLETAKVIKKEPGINPKDLSNKEKRQVIDALRDKYRLRSLLNFMHMSKSSYCYRRAASAKQDRYAAAAEMLRRSFDESGQTYGYRRLWLCLRNAGTRLSEKIVRRLMRQEHLQTRTVHRKKYSSYMGEISPAVPNWLQRDFHADKPNEKWVTDITEFTLPEGKVYLSPIIDCFDGMPVSWTIGRHPSAKLANCMLEQAMRRLRPGEFPIVHSDRGGHYRWPGWIRLMEAAGLKRSMSAKGCTPDNSACEGFFGRLKNEMFYGFSWEGVPISEFMKRLNSYMLWYAGSRIKVSLGGLSPVQYRLRHGFSV